MAFEVLKCGIQSIKMWHMRCLNVTFKVLKCGFKVLKCGIRGVKCGFKVLQCGIRGVKMCPELIVSTYLYWEEYI